MPSFFDPLLVEQQGAAFIRADMVDDALNKLIPGAHISKGKFSCPSRSELRDLTWNHMDQNHRPFIHRTYDTASRIFVDRQASFALTRFGRWPFVIPVFDGYFKENGFYQVIVLFGLIAIVSIIESNQEGNAAHMDVSWAIASHRWLRFLHPLLHRRLIRLNEVQNREDEPVRERRVELRAAGYRFRTDDPNFFNSNVVENNTIFPPVAAPTSLALADLPLRQAVSIATAGRAFILRRDDKGVEVWPGVCPHEGAELNLQHLGSARVKCPWHGLEFPPRRLIEGETGIEMCGARLELADGKILVKPSLL